MKHSRRTRDALAKYGPEVCTEAYRRHCAGDGASTIGYCMKLTTRQADAAIDAGRELQREDQPSTAFASARESAIDEQASIYDDRYDD